MVAKGDVRKMYNCVKLVKADAFIQCFLWRDMDPKQEPKTFQVTVNNIGVKPAGAIATLALHKSAEVFKAEFPDTARQLQARSYVDDLGIAAQNSELLRKHTEEAVMSEYVYLDRIRIRIYSYRAFFTEYEYE